MQKTINGVEVDPLRRCRIESMTPAETAISAAIQAVESLPADTRLTDAVVLLMDAQRKVADWVDGIGATSPKEDSCQTR
jgi:hypothetical protein